MFRIEFIMYGFVSFLTFENPQKVKLHEMCHVFGDRRWRKKE